MTGEYLVSPGEAEDPLGEDNQSPVPGLVHRYPDRALFLTTSFCSTNCRYCTRSRMVGDQHKFRGGIKQWQQAIAYIESKPEIKDVLLSGGDPLTLPDSQLEFSPFQHQTHTARGDRPHRLPKCPPYCPSGSPPGSVRMLKKYHPCG